MRFPIGSILITPLVHEQLYFPCGWINMGNFQQAASQRQIRSFQWDPLKQDNICPQQSDSDEPSSKTLTELISSFSFLRYDYSSIFCFANVHQEGNLRSISSTKTKANESIEHIKTHIHPLMPCTGIQLGIGSFLVSLFVLEI
jgi:hypothetical protein